MAVYGDVRPQVATVGTAVLARVGMCQAPTSETSFSLVSVVKKKDTVYYIYHTLPRKVSSPCSPAIPGQNKCWRAGNQYVFFFFLEIQLCCKRITEGVIWWKSVAKISKIRFVIREFLDYLKWVRNHRILSCFKAVCALCGWGVDAWHGSSRESRHRQDVGLCAFVVEREKKLRLSPALRCILRARRTFWRWAAGDLCGSDWTETVRLTEACTLTDSSLNALFTFVCVWQNKGEACLVSVRQYLVARSVERPLALETHGTHLNFDLIHAKYWPCN